mmetsp:Transcript_8704/g.12797  ORF Transcript_8704/g.12797 Transcript_8704/m.12797 type:complete len:174 (+) Transcript_8704:140-661(+)
MSTIEGLKPYALLGGYNAAELWPTINLILPTWFLIAVAPRWKYTPTLTLIGPIIHALIYTLSTISLMSDPEHNDGDAPDFSTFEGVVNLFKDPNGVFVGWIHYVVFDALVGRWIALDSVDRGCSLLVHVFVIIPIIFLTLMLGPMGWLLYVAVVRTLLLPSSNKNDTTKAKNS